MMTYGESERLYAEAREKGILFIPFEQDRPPRLNIEDGRPVVEGFDPMLGEPVRLRPDWVVPAVGLDPTPVDDLTTLLGLETTQDGFIQEANTKWRPVDTGREGIFVCGLARAPGRVDEVMREGEAAAQRAARIPALEIIRSQRVAARVRHSLCSLCEQCIDACPYGARYVDPESDRIMVDPVSCQGCGACAAVCPNSATVIGDFEDFGIMASIEAAL
jgi:heterodisulfide reductase subunit A